MMTGAQRLSGAVLYPCYEQDDSYPILRRLHIHAGRQAQGGGRVLRQGLDPVATRGHGCRVRRRRGRSAVRPRGPAAMRSAVVIRCADGRRIAQRAAPETLFSSSCPIRMEVLRSGVRCVLSRSTQMRPGPIVRSVPARDSLGDPTRCGVRYSAGSGYRGKSEFFDQHEVAV